MKSFDINHEIMKYKLHNELIYPSVALEVHKLTKHLNS